MTFEDFQRTVTDWLPTVRRIAERYFYRGAEVFYKGDASPVTAADREVEAYLVGEIARLFPGHGILGEESGVHAGRGDAAAYQWVLDPIDGTRSFIAGVPLFSTLIALTYHGRPLYGAVYLPVQDRAVFGDGRVALCGGRPVRMRETAAVEEAVVVSSGVAAVYKYHDGPAFADLMLRCRCFRTWGDGFGYYLLATGRADVMVDPHMSPWDMMAVIPVIEGAGGKVTDYAGRDPVGSDSVIAARPALHARVLECLSGKK